MITIYLCDDEDDDLFVKTTDMAPKEAKLPPPSASRIPYAEPQVVPITPQIRRS